MKKICMGIFCLLLGTSVFASEKWLANYNLGVGIPFFKADIEATDTIDVETKGYGINFSTLAQLINKDNGFLFQAGIGIGGLKAENFYENEDQWGFCFNGNLGLGYAFKYDEKAIIGLAAIFGYAWASISKDVPYSYSGSTYLVDLSTSTIDFYIGANLTGTIRLSEKLGVFGSFLFAVPIFGWETAKVSVSGVSQSESFDIKAGGYFIQPAIGVSITID